MTDGEPVADLTALEEAKNEFSTRDSAGDEAVADAGGRQDGGRCVRGVETVASLCIRDAGAAHSLGGCNRGEEAVSLC